MTWKTIKEYAELYRRDTVQYPKHWFNEGKELLATMYKTACKSATQTYPSSVVDTEYALPTDCKYVHKVVDDNYPTDKLEDYNIDSITNKIVFLYNGDYTVTYLKVTADTSGTEGETPEINAAYHNCLSKYIAAKELEYIRDSRHQALLQEFFAEAAAADASIRGADKSNKRIPRLSFR
jgi:hypothetical protein